jgi:O-antigen/teichoic acid export membrane protein
VLKKIKELASDSLIYGTSTIIGQLAGLFLVPFYTKVFSPTAYGLFNMTTVITAFIVPVASLGMDAALFRYYSLAKTEEEKLRYFSNATILKTVAVILILLLMVPFYNLLNGWLFENKLLKSQFLILLGSILFDSFSALSVIALRSERKVKSIAGVNLIVLGIGIGLSIFFVLILRMGVTGAMVSGLLAAIIRSLLFLRTSNKNFSFQNIEKKYQKQLLSYGLPMVPHKIQGFIITMFTAFIINQKLGLAYAGLYAVATKLAKPMTFVVGIVQQAWTPYKYQIHKTDTNPVSTFRNLTSLYWVLLLFLWGGISVISPFMYNALISSKYWEGKSFVPFISFITVAQGMYFTVTTGFELSTKQKRMVTASFFGMVFLVVCTLLTLNYYPPYSFFIAQSISFFILSIIIYPEARKFIKIDYPFLTITLLTIFVITCVAVFYKYQSLTAALWTFSAISLSCLITLLILFPNYYLYFRKVKAKLIGSKQMQPK